MYTMAEKGKAVDGRVHKCTASRHIMNGRFLHVVPAKRQAWSGRAPEGFDWVQG